MSDRFEKFQRALAMFCAIVLFFTAFNGTPVFEIFAVGPEIQILHDEAPVTEVKLEQDGKIRLTVPCMFCPKPHQYVLSHAAFFDQSIYSFCRHRIVNTCTHTANTSVAF